MCYSTGMLEFIPVGEETFASHPHKTGSWYFLEIALSYFLEFRYFLELDVLKLFSYMYGERGSKKRDGLCGYCFSCLFSPVHPQFKEKKKKGLLIV